MALLLFMTLAAWSMGSAVGGSPDEDYVLTSIWCGTEGNPPYCKFGAGDPNGMILPALVTVPQLCYVAVGQDFSASCQIDIQDQFVETLKFNLGLYPHSYFNFQRNFVGADVEVSVVKMRLFNSFLAAVLIIAAGVFFSKKNSD